MKRRDLTDLSKAWVYDIEAENWDTFILGALCRADGTGPSEVYTWRTERDFVKRLLSLEGVLWAFNGGRYDTLWLCEQLKRQHVEHAEVPSDGEERVIFGAEIFASSARVTLVRIGERLDVRDICALVPGMSLGEAAELAGMAKTRSGLPCNCGEGCGGYCSHSRKMTREAQKLLASYCENDCRVGAGVLRRIMGYAREHKIDVKGTIGSTAWKFMASRADVKKADWTRHDYQFCRRGYHGGRCQVFLTSLERGVHDDINSCYPAALNETALPVGARRTLFGLEARRALELGQPGIYDAEVCTPLETYLPVLPWKDDAQRLHYPVGTYRGTWAGNELVYAFSTGVELRQVVKAIVWEGAEPVLRAPMQHIWQLRDEAKRAGDPIHRWLKFMANAPTGKLAQHPEHEQIVMSSDPTVAYCKGGRDCLFGCSEKCGKYRPLGWKSGLWVKDVWRIPAHGHVHWAAYLTASARVKLHRQAVADGQGGRTVAYCDTDSLFLAEPRSANMGPGLGQWSRVDAFVWFEALAPKTYRYWSLGDKEDEKPHEVVRSKGILAPVWNDLVSHVTMSWSQGVKQLRSAALTGERLFERRTLTRTMRHDSLHYGDRVVGPDGRTYPRTLQGEVWHGW